MNLEQIATPLRPRSPWEAADLGIAMVRTWWPQALFAWALITIPCFVLAFSALSVGWASLILWWLRPLFERLPLFVYSRAMFGALPSVQETIEALPGLSIRGLFAALTWRRFDPLRSFHLPILQLEGLRGSQYRKRCSILNRNFSNGALALTLIGPWIELILSASTLLLVFFFVPQSSFDRWIETIWNSGEFPQSWILTVTSAVVMFFAWTFAELIYTASGFALYISRRQELEGWDVELAFRRLASRITKTATDNQTNKITKLGAVLLFCGCLVTLPITSLSAQERPPEKQSSSRTIIDAVLAHEDFSRSHSQSRWRPKDSALSSSQDNPDSFGAGLALSAVIRVLVILSLLLVLVIIIWLIARSTSKRSQAKPRSAAAPEILFGLDIRPESLPEDVAASALQLLSRGDITACLSLLYRATLADIVTRRKLPIERSSTEHDCMLLITETGNEDEADYFKALSSAWQSCAYGHRTPPDHITRSLCTSWASQFGVQS